MRDLLLTFDKAVLADFIIQRMGFRRAAQVEKDLIYLAWEAQTKKACQMADDACARMAAAKTTKLRQAASADFDVAMRAHDKADKLWKRLEALK